MSDAFEDVALLPKPTRSLPAERRAIAQQGKSERSRLERDAERRVKAMVRQRDGHRCRFCSDRAYEVAHGFSEGGYPSVRFIGINLFTACRPCHVLGHKHPTRWRQSIAALLGQEDFWKLERAAMAAGTGPDPAEVIAACRRGEFVELEA